MTFDELYRAQLKRAARGEPPERGLAPSPWLEEALLSPQRYAPVWVTADCSGCSVDGADCCAACLFGAIGRDADGKISIDPEKCSGCAACLAACSSGKLEASRDALPALYAIKQAKGPVYALLAPSSIGQYSEDETQEGLRSALLMLGFAEIVEVALFADILTLREALSFEKHIHSKGDFQLTSCCCPVWISLLKSGGRAFLDHVPGAVSPMIAAGRTVKTLFPDALTVFIGPCLAKKTEARDRELRGAVDWVLTYAELRDIFEAAGIEPESTGDERQSHASKAGILYGRAGGVSEAVRETLRRLCPDRAEKMTVSRADGTDNCKAMLKRLLAGEEKASYFEGMGCRGGCVGGPRTIQSREQGRENVDRCGAKTKYITPLDNPHVQDLLERLGFDTVEDFLENSDIYSRSFL